MTQFITDATPRQQPTLQASNSFHFGARFREDPVLKAREYEMLAKMESIKEK